MWLEGQGPVQASMERPRSWPWQRNSFLWDALPLAGLVVADQALAVALHLRWLLALELELPLVQQMISRVAGLDSHLDPVVLLGHLVVLVVLVVVAVVLVAAGSVQVVHLRSSTVAASALTICHRMSF